MATRDEQRAEEIAALRMQAREALMAIDNELITFPTEANLGTWRAVRNTVVRAKVEVQDYVDREFARRESRDER